MNWFYRLLTRGGEVATQRHEVQNVASKGADCLFATEQVYDGYLALASEKETSIKGVVRLSIERVEVAKVVHASVKLEVVGHRPWVMTGRFQMEESRRGGILYFEEKKTVRLELEVAGDNMKGKFIHRRVGAAEGAKGYFIVGWRNLVESGAADDLERARQVLKRWQGILTLAWKCDPYVGGGKNERERFAGWNSYTLGIDKGRVQVCGVSVEGMKMLTSAAVLIDADGTCRVPVVINKNDVAHAFGIVLSANGEVVVKGVKDVCVGMLAPLAAATLKFQLEEGYPLWGQLGGGFPYTEYLPMELELHVGEKGEWISPKAGKVTRDQYGRISQRKLGSNPSALSLGYNASDGTFKGTFNAYVNKNGWPKAYVAQVNGVMIKGKGYGTACIKNVGSVPITLQIEEGLT